MEALLTTDRLAAIACFAFAAVIALQAWLAMRERQAMRERWTTLAATVVDQRERVETDNDGTSWTLELTVETAEGRREPRPLLAQSDAELADLAARHPVGSTVKLRVDPKHGTLWVEGHMPDTGPGWLIATAIGLAGLGVAAWFGALALLR